jgi:hypothetical protein
MTGSGSQEQTSDRHFLLNGRIWHNKYSKVFGDQFFISDKTMTGSVIFNDQWFTGLSLKYDIANDELILINQTHPVIILNKEMIDSFSLAFNGKVYNFINAGSNPDNILNGYVNILYKGRSALYMKCHKKIQVLAVDGRYDLFVDDNKTYLDSRNRIVRVDSKRKLLSLLADRKKEIRSYIRENKLKVKGNDPESFIPVVEYYDSLNN